MIHSLIHSFIFSNYMILVSVTMDHWAQSAKTSLMGHQNIAEYCRPPCIQTFRHSFIPRGNLVSSICLLSFLWMETREPGGNQGLNSTQTENWTWAHGTAAPMCSHTNELIWCYLDYYHVICLSYQSLTVGFFPPKELG